MRLGVVSDVHGNRVALEAVLDDMPAVDGLACAGDVVGYNPWPADCVAAIRERGVPTVMGNHDRAVASGTAFRFNSMAKAGVEHARTELDDDSLDWLADLPDERSVADGRVRVVHGHPDDPDHYTYPEEFGPDLLAAAGEPAVLVMGHTHVQHHETYDDGVVLNPGSVGQPRDGDPRAAYAVVDLGDDSPSVTERRVEYDVDRVVAAVADAGLPSRIGERLYDGR
jgi:putative phosphoesterase